MRVGLPWASLLAYVRITTNPRVFDRPLKVETALEQVDAWLGHPAVTTPDPTERHGEILGTLLRSAGLGGNLVGDAHLAALSLEHGLVLCSTDSDFARFPRVRWHDPLRGRGELP